MKSKPQLLAFVFLLSLSISNLWSSDRLARISDQVIYTPEDGSYEIENIRTSIVLRITKVDGEEPTRQEKVPYVLLEEGTHKLEVEKSKVFSKPEETNEKEIFECSVKAGLIYEIRHTEEGIILEEREKK